MVLTLNTYGVNDITGVKFGFKGFFDDSVERIKVREGAREGRRESEAGQERVKMTGQENLDGAGRNDARM